LAARSAGIGGSLTPSGNGLAVTVTVQHKLLPRANVSRMYAECFDKVLYHVNSRILKCKMTNVITRIHTLTDVVIIDSMQVDSIQGFATSNVAQTKERSYRTQHPTNQFLLLTIEIFDYLYKHVNEFLHDCANAIWSLKGLEGPHLSTLVIFFHLKILITL
jgi:hypothetical protein